MNRFDPLNPGAVPDPAGERFAVKARAKRGTCRKNSPKIAAGAKVTLQVSAIPLATFACLIGTSEQTAATEARDKFAAYCAAHPEFRDWRVAWRAFVATPAADTGAELRKRFEEKAARLRQYQPLSKIFPASLRRILRAHPGHLAQFERAR